MIKYNSYKSETINLTENNDVYEITFDDEVYEYIRIFNISGHFKIYLNGSSEYFYVNGGYGLELKDFGIFKLKIEAVWKDYSGNSLQYYVLK